MSERAISLFEAFRFKRKNTPVHNLDPRAKLYLAIIASALSLIFAELVPLVILLLALIPIIILAGSIREWARSMRGLVIFIVFIAVINTIFTTVTFAVAMVTRLVALMTAFSIFFLTVHPDDLAQALIQMRIPFSFAFAMSMAIRYVPTIAQEAQTIREAQMSRGLELERGNIIKRIRNFIPIIVPLIIGSIRRALSVAESLESRAFGSTKNRTYLHPLKMGGKDYAVIVILTLILVGLVYIRFFVGLPSWAYWTLPI
ncbi:MAG: energy-coupling factor transporter transmembrane component T family protein [Promethearchaeota archaeon]